MSVENYYVIPNATKLASAAELSILRAQKLATAIEQYRHTTLIDVFRSNNTERGICEYIVIDIECDDVPPKNTFNLNYRERLALAIIDDPQMLIDVWALRKDFPVLMHQNESLPDAPHSLCLYFEPAISVLRTWTPQNFLKKLIWWIEASSRGALHPADQPVEQLFFVTKYELVLPWNYDEIKQDENTNLLMVPHSKREDGGVTFVLADKPNEYIPAEYIDIELQPVLHGDIITESGTLGGLADKLNLKGIDLISALADKIKSRVTEEGVHIDQDAEHTVILLQIPIKRTEDAPPETISRRAYIIDKGYLQLGEDIGILFHAKETDNKFYIVQPLFAQDNQPVHNDWRDIDILSMTVLLFNDSKRARIHSGIEDEGTDMVLIGAGSLGGLLLELWTRSGWGKWVVIDKDHIKPHNLSRHPAHACHVGFSKTDVLSNITWEITQGENQAVSICADALKIDAKDVSHALHNTNLIIDASTTLDYPRKASEHDGLARHISTFITPNGNSAVLMIEDHKRKIRLRTLEAQYYRAVINETWGGTHLGVKPGTFWSGNSCRDVSFVMPYTKITTHAGNLAEQIQLRSLEEEAFIAVWQREPETGCIEYHNILVQPENKYDFGEFKILVDEGVLEKLRQFRERELPNETGGILLGYYDFNLMNLVIVDALPAPDDSDSGQSWFERGIKGLADAVQDASDRTSGIVKYVGEWHSHPDGYSIEPSQNDVIQLSALAIAMNDDGLPAVIMIVGNADFNIIQGTIADA